MQPVLIFLAGMKKFTFIKSTQTLFEILLRMMQSAILNMAALMKHI